MLHFILGKSGSGKTREALNIITSLRKSGNKRLMLLVPDQSSFDTETALLHKLGALESRDVLVFGFNRLCDYVFKNTGNIPQNVIDDGVRKIIMSRAIDEVKDRLSIFSGSSKRKSVLDLMLYSLREFRKDHISTESLVSVSGNVESDILKNKLTETSLVLDAYDALLSCAYIDPIENLDRLSNILLENNMFSGYDIVLDSFSGFTYQQLSVLEILMRDSSEFYVTLNLDVESKSLELFETTNRTYNQLKRMAKSNSVELGKEKILSEFKRSDREDISFLENNIYRPKKNQFPEKAENITTFIASDIYGEAEFVAQKILELVSSEVYFYGDIAVVNRNMEKYDGILDTVFDKYDIPYYKDDTRDIFTMPVIRFISSAIDAALMSFDREAVLSMLKTGMTPFSPSQIAEFENYLFVWSLDRSKLKKPFVNNPSGFEKLTDEDERTLKRLEKMRESLISPLEEFSKVCKDADGLEISRALYSLMESYRVADAVDAYYDARLEQGMLSEADDAVRSYNALTEALDKLVSVIGSEKISLKKYREYLDFLISDIRLGEIPRYQDQVNIASADRVRLRDEKVVFVIGAVDGEFPAVARTAGAFSEHERRVLIENSIPLVDTLEKFAAHEKYLVYCALTSASDKLFVSSYAGDLSGETYKPSEIYGEVERLFPKRTHLTQSDLISADRLCNRRQAFEFLSRSFTEGDSKTNALRAYFKADARYSPLVEKLDKAVKKLPFHINSREISENLFKKQMKISASQVEAYNMCAFRYFCNYGLRAKERKKAEIDPIQFGNIVHFFMERFLKEHEKRALNSLSDSDIKGSIDSILLEYADEKLGGLDDKPESFMNLFERLKENILELIKHIINQLGYSDFIPCDFEFGIGSDTKPYKLELDGERSVSVTGYIDRVDRCDKNSDETYIRVVDYKTGNKEFKLYEILYGINLQMLIYLRALEQNGGEYYKSRVIPAGVLYMPASLEIIDSEKYPTESKVKAQLGSTLRMNGLVLSDEEVLEHMDRLGKFIKFSRNVEDGMYSDSVASGEQFVKIFEHIDSVLRDMADNLHMGNVEAKPLKGAVNGCAYCPYDSVCLRTYEDDYKFRKKASPKEVFRALEEEGEMPDE
ncbi:MAG: PD-(D/E)XK nuclease family protein [Ruminococcus sp.]|nr:PD-(D/E)XK nuclease family protein [Ruminococcus sp.]